MKLPSHRIFPSMIAACALFAAGAVGRAAAYTWTPTSAGTTYDWLTNTQNNWGTGVGGAFPSAAGDIADLNINILGNQTIRLGADVTIGTLKLGDADGLSTYAINSMGTPTKVLTFQTAIGNAAIDLGTAGTSTNTIGTNVFLASALDITSSVTSSQRLTTTGTFDTNGMAVRVTGGANQVPTWTVTGDLLGSANINFTGLGGITVSTTVKSFTGTITLSGTGRGGADGNSGALTTTTGSLRNAAMVTINGAFSGAMLAAGGAWHSGNGSGAAGNPGQRFTEHRIVLNSGWLDDGGQAAAAVLPIDVGTGTGTDTSWRRGAEFVRDDLEAVRFNSGYSLIVVNASTSTAGTILDGGLVERAPGAAVYMRSSDWALRSRFTFDNSASLLKGAGGSPGSTTMSIIPWMAAGAATSGPSTFATYVASGIRPLDLTTEVSGSITAGADHNVQIGTIPALAASTTINSLRLTSSATSNMGADRILTVASGGVFFATNSSAIGGLGSGTAGTLDFANAEGVVWSNSTNTNGIGASITGTGGLSKAGTGTLVLTGLANTYSGLTYVSGGTLQIGDGANASSLGLSLTVKVAPGAKLTLMGGDMIQDTASLALEQFGLFNGRVQIASGVNEFVDTLFLGSVLATPGTYGSDTSPATFKVNSFFEGDGVLTVLVPEPGSALLLAAGFTMLAARRRRE